MNSQLFALGGLGWLLVPFIGFAYLALKRAYSSVDVPSQANETLAFRVYVLSVLSSMMYFLVVSYTLLVNWMWGARVGQSSWSSYHWTLDSWAADPLYFEELNTFSMPVLDLVHTDSVWINHPTNFLEFVNIGGWLNISFGVDGLSLSLIVLTAFIVPLCLLYCQRNVHSYVSMAFYLIILEILLVIAFWTRDLVLFFIMFEVILWPMYRLIVTWGSHEAKKKAAMSFVLYTVFGSLILLIVILASLVTFKTTSIDVMSSSFPEQSWWAALLWVPAFIAFAVKVPTWPFHHWLTLAHVEAPTVGSVILAALLLKLGSYGFLRYMLPLFSDPIHFSQFMPLAATLCLLSVIFAALMAISQSDLKRIVAYSSIAHMNFSLLGLLSMSDRAIVGGTILFIAHGFVSAAMFFSVGMMYDRYHQRDLLYYRGLASVAPVFSLLYFLTNLANLGVPLSFNFLGEFLIFAEVMNIYYFAAPLLIVALIIQVGYTMKLVSILFGDTIQFVNAPKLVWSDLTLHEIVILVLLVIPAYYFGIRGDNFIDLMRQIDPLLNHSGGHYVEGLIDLLDEKELVLTLNETDLW